jgi:hypothetical protein
MQQANLFLPQSHKVPYRLSLRTIKLMIPQRQQGWVTQEVIVLMSPVKSSQNQPSDTETNDAAGATAAAGAPMAADRQEPRQRGAWVTTWMTTHCQDQLLTMQPRHPLAIRGQQHTSSGLWSPSCMPWMCSSGLTVAGARLSTTYETRSLQHTSIFWFLICSIGIGIRRQIDWRGEKRRESIRCCQYRLPQKDGRGRPQHHCPFGCGQGRP